MPHTARTLQIRRMGAVNAVGAQFLCSLNIRANARDRAGAMLRLWATGNRKAPGLLPTSPAARVVAGFAGGAGRQGGAGAAVQTAPDGRSRRRRPDQPIASGTWIIGKSGGMRPSTAWFAATAARTISRASCSSRGAIAESRPEQVKT